jgi:6-phosphofructokinase
MGRHCGDARLASPTRSAPFPGSVAGGGRCIFCPEQATQGAPLKIVEIVPRARARLYGTLVAKEAAIRKSGRGTYVRVGRKSQHAARWKHKKFKGTLQLSRGASEAVTAKVRAATPEDERKLLSSFLGFVDRHAGDQVTTITIHYH